MHVETAGPGASRQPSGLGRHHALDLVRGLAALAVTQYHFMNWNRIATIESMGTFAVYVFFVLSGLTMMMVYADRFSAGVTPQVVRVFFRKRVARLLPLLAVVAVLAGVHQSLSSTNDVAAAVLTGTGLMALGMPGFLSNSVGAWSLGIELAFYAVFPVVAMLARSWRTVAVAAAVLIAGQHLLLWKIKSAPVFWDYYVSNLIFAPFFALGILAWFDCGPRRAAMLGVTLLCFTLVLFYSTVVNTDLMRDQFSYLLLTAGCAVVVWAAWRSSLPRWLIPVATILGDISYSLYLTHWIVNDAVRVLRLPIAVHWALFTTGALVGSYLCYRLFEAPMRDRFGTRADAKREPRTAQLP